MSPAPGLSPRDQTRRGRLALGAMAVVLVVVAAVALLTDDGGDPDEARTGGSSTTSAPDTERTPSTGASTTTVASAVTTGAPAPGASTTAPVPTTTAPTPAGCAPVEAIAEWPLRRRLAALVMVGVDPSGTGEATEAVEDHHVGGLFVGGNPTGLLTSGALEELRAASPTGLMVSVDEEGGRVQRIEALDGEVPSAREMAATITEDAVRALAARRARVMAAHGVTVDLAPVVDVSDQPDDSVIGDRSWSDDADVVVAYGRAYAEGLLAEGITPVLKHFPGHGSSSGDTHDGSATTPSLDDLRSSDLVPYEALVPELGPRTGVMLGHLDVPGLTEPDTPTSLSPATVSLLRDDYGFAGVIMTDDLSAMGAITNRFGVADAAVQALAAGVDMVLFAGTDVGELLDHMEAAVADGDLDEGAIDASVARTLTLKGIDPCTVAL